MEYLFEPQLVGLVHRDEQQLVVMRGIRKAVLQIDQVLHAQVLVV
jgi:hypothetical protein